MRNLHSNISDIHLSHGFPNAYELSSRLFAKGILPLYHGPVFSIELNSMFIEIESAHRLVIGRIDPKTLPLPLP